MQQLFMDNGGQPRVGSKNFGIHVTTILKGHELPHVFAALPLMRGQSRLRTFFHIVVIVHSHFHGVRLERSTAGFIHSPVCSHCADLGNCVSRALSRVAGKWSVDHLRIATTLHCKTFWDDDYRILHFAPCWNFHCADPRSYSYFDAPVACFWSCPSTSWLTPVSIAHVVKLVLTLWVVY